MRSTRNESYSLGPNARGGVLDERDLKGSGNVDVKFLGDCKSFLTMRIIITKLTENGLKYHLAQGSYLLGGSSTPIRITFN